MPGILIKIFSMFKGAYLYVAIAVVAMLAYWYHTHVVSDLTTIIEAQGKEIEQAKNEVVKQKILGSIKDSELKVCLTNIDLQNNSIKAAAVDKDKLEKALQKLKNRPAVEPPKGESCEDKLDYFNRVLRKHK